MKKRDGLVLLSIVVLAASAYAGGIGVTTAPPPLPVSVANGGTGAVTAPAALSNLGAVPTSTTVNGHALTANVTVSKSDVGLGSVVDGAALPATTGSAVQKASSGGLTAAAAGDVDGILPTQTGNSGMVLKTNGSTSSWVAELARYSRVIDGGGAVPSTGVYWGIHVPFAGTITGWNVLGTTAAGASATGSFTATLYKCASASAPCTTATSGTLSVVSATLNSGTGWTVAVALDDWIGVNVTKVTTFGVVIPEITVAISR